MLQFIIIVLWLSTGYIGVRMSYYGLMEKWYQRYKEDYRKYNKGENSLRLWNPHNFPGCILFIYGPVSLFLPLFIGIKYRWKYKIPK